MSEEIKNTEEKAVETAAENTPNESRNQQRRNNNRRNDRRNTRVSRSRKSISISIVGNNKANSSVLYYPSLFGINNSL